MHNGWKWIPVKVSTHAPREGRDTSKLYDNPWEFMFQPTRPARGATAANTV